MVKHSGIGLPLNFLTFREPKENATSVTYVSLSERGGVDSSLQSK